MSSKLCPHCMRMAENEICPHCGKNINYAGMPLHLPAGYVIHGRHSYVLGAALGQGGFGITYIALDMATGQRVAIKEFFPTFCCGRTGVGSVIPYQSQDDTFLKGKERFLDEAKVLKNLSDLKSIVNVLDFFEFNNSAYLVMEYLDGVSLKDYVEKHGPFPAQPFLKQIRTLMEDIELMHQRGVVHRDIAPDNIILLPNGQMKLIDFGAARSFVGDKSMTVVVKKGFAPVEQYLTKGVTAATDVYALAATMYYCITGVVPMDSAERQYDNAPLPPPSTMGVDITPAQEKALSKALTILQNKRTQSAQAFVTQLFAPSTISKSIHASTITPKNQPKKQKKLLPILAIAAVALVLVGAIFLVAGSGVGPKATPILMADTGDNQVFGGEYQRHQISSITFLDSTKEAGEESWDVSRDQNGSVLAWVEPNNNLYDLYIGADDLLVAPEDCSKLFAGYTKLHQIEFNGVLNTTETTSMNAMFMNCTDLMELNLSGLDTSNVKDMGSMFTNCMTLNKLDLSGFSTTNVTNMSEMFKDCSNLAELNITGFDLSHVENYSGFLAPERTINGRHWTEFFKSDTPYTETILGSFHILMTDMVENSLHADEPNDPTPAFGGPYMRDQIASITFLASSADAPADSWDVSLNQDGSVLAWVNPLGNLYDLYIGADGGVQAPEDCSDMFAAYSNLRQIDFNGAFNTSNTTSMATMFGCSTALTRLDLSGFDTSNVSNMRYMFWNCTALTELDLTSLDTSNVTEMRSIFSKCSGLTRLNISTLNTSSATDISFMFYECSSLTELDLSGFDTSKVADMQYMFYMCSSLTELDLSGFDTSEVMDMQYMFSNCTSLTELDLSGFDTSKVETMEDMFEYCSSLTKLNVSGFNTAAVTNMEFMFYECSNLTELDVSHFDTAKVTSMRSMFSKCHNLTALDVSNFNTANVTTMRYMFRDCGLLTQLDLSNFNTSNVTEMNCMFYKCTSLTELDVSSFDTGNVTTMDYMFNGCKALTDLDVSHFDVSSVESYEDFMDSGRTINGRPWKEFFQK